MLKLWRCDDCGEIFEEDELDFRYESRGEFWGSPCSEQIWICPCCHSDEIDEYEEEFEEELPEDEEEEGEER